MVTVVDASTGLEKFKSSKSLAEGVATQEGEDTCSAEDPRTISHLMTDQVQFADGKHLGAFIALKYRTFG